MYISNRFLNPNNVQSQPVSTNRTEEVLPDLESPENQRLVEKLNKEVYTSLFENARRRTDGTLDTSILDNLSRNKRKPVSHIREYAIIRCIMTHLKSSHRTTQRLASEYALHIFKGLNSQFADNPAVKYLKIYSRHQVEVAVGNLKKNFPEFNLKQLTECLSKFPVSVLWCAKNLCMSDLSLISKTLDQRNPGMLETAMNAAIGFENLQSIIKRLDKLDNSGTQTRSAPTWDGFFTTRFRISKEEREESLQESRDSLFSKNDLDTPYILMGLGNNPEYFIEDQVIFEAILSAYHSHNIDHQIIACKYIENFVKEFSPELRYTALPLISNYSTLRLDFLSQFSATPDNSGNPTPFMRELLKWSDIELWFVNHLADDRLQKMKPEQKNCIRERMKLLEIDRYHGSSLNELLFLTGRRQNFCNQLLGDQQINESLEPTQLSGSPEKPENDNNNLDSDKIHDVTESNNDNNNVTSTRNRSDRKHLLEKDEISSKDNSTHTLDPLGSNRRKLNDDFYRPREIVNLVHDEENVQSLEKDQPKKKLFDKNKQSYQQIESDSEERESD